MHRKMVSSSKESAHQNKQTLVTTTMIPQLRYVVMMKIMSAIVETIVSVTSAMFVTTVDIENLTVAVQIAWDVTIVKKIKKIVSVI